MCEFGQLIHEPLLSHDLMLNVHPSLLPRWRGAAPIERALMAGDAVHRRDDLQDHRGPRQRADGAASARSRSSPTTRAARSATRLARLGGELLIESFDAAEAGALELTEQPEEGVTYAEKIEPEERRLDPSRPAVELERVVRALTPEHRRVPRAGGRRAPGSRGRARGRRVAASPGELRVVDGHACCVGCAEGALELRRR